MSISLRWRIGGGESASISVRKCAFMPMSAAYRQRPESCPHRPHPPAMCELQEVRSDPPGRRRIHSSWAFHQRRLRRENAPAVMRGQDGRARLDPVGDRVQSPRRGRAPGACARWPSRRTAATPRPAWVVGRGSAAVRDAPLPRAPPRERRSAPARRQPARRTVTAVVGRSPRTAVMPGASGRTRTDTSTLLRSSPLPLGYGGGRRPHGPSRAPAPRSGDRPRPRVVTIPMPTVATARLSVDSAIVHAFILP